MRIEEFDKNACAHIPAVRLPYVSLQNLLAGIRAYRSATCWFSLLVFCVHNVWKIVYYFVICSEFLISSIYS